MAIALEHVVEQFAQRGLVVHAQDAARDGSLFVRVGLRIEQDDFADGENQPHGRALAGFAFDLDAALVPVQHAINHGQSQSRAAPALGREERFQTPAPGGLIHAGAVVADFKDDELGNPGRGLVGFFFDGVGADGDDAAFGNRIHGVDDQVGQRFADLAFEAGEFADVGIQLGLHFDHDAVALRDVAPARTGHVHDLHHERIGLHHQHGIRLVFVALAVKFTQPGHDVRDILAGGPDVMQMPLGILAHAGLGLDDQIRETDHGRQRVVDVMGDAAGHLAERLEAFLLHDDLLRLAQFVEGFLQLFMQLRLMRGQRDVLAQRAEKFTFAGGEGVRLVARGDEHAEQFALDQHGFPPPPWPCPPGKPSRPARTIPAPHPAG